MLVTGAALLERSPPRLHGFGSNDLVPTYSAKFVLTFSMLQETSKISETVQSLRRALLEAVSYPPARQSL